MFKLLKGAAFGQAADIGTCRGSCGTTIQLPFLEINLERDLVPFSERNAPTASANLQASAATDLPVFFCNHPKAKRNNLQDNGFSREKQWLEIAKKKVDFLLL